MASGYVRSTRLLVAQQPLGEHQPELGVPGARYLLRPALSVGRMQPRKQLELVKKQLGRQGDEGSRMWLKLVWEDPELLH